MSARDRHPTLALDWGARRVGLAASDALGLAAHGLPTLVRTGRAADLEHLERIVRERGVVRLLVGRPLLADGTAGKSARAAEEFGRSLAKRCGLPVVFRDERLTSHEAQQRLRESGRRKFSKADIDREAAAILLEDDLAAPPEGAAL